MLKFDRYKACNINSGHVHHNRTRQSRNSHKWSCLDGAQTINTSLAHQCLKKHTPSIATL